MWVIDIRHWLDETQTGSAAPRLKRKVEKLSQIIMYATSVKAGIPVYSPPACWRRPEHKPCQGVLEIGINPAGDQIHWICPICGDEGVISGWKGTIWDMSDKPGNLH